jgi:tRNA(Ile)-lysidine synthase
MKNSERDWLAFCQKVWQFIRKHELLDEQQKVVVAVSGGIDSIVLLDFFLWARAVKRIEFAAAHVNHLLRGKESDGDEKFVGTLCNKNNIPFYSERVDTKKVAKKMKRSIQLTARDLRYTFFDTLRTTLNANCIATAHNANDNAETMLINVFRGSGIEGVGGIPVKRDAIIRPFLFVPRKEIEKHARAKKLQFREDSSNQHDDYTRNYLRRNIIPMIEQRINPSLIETMTKLSEIYRSNADFVEETLRRSIAGVPSQSEISIAQLKQLHPYLQQMLIHRMLIEKNIEPRYDAVISLLELQHTQKGKTVDLNKQFVAERTSDAIELRSRMPAKPFNYQLSGEGTIETNDFVFSMKKSAVPDNRITVNSSEEYVDAAAVRFPVTVRSWKKGDIFFPLGMKGKKKLSDFFGEKKYSSAQKLTIPVVESGNSIMWIAGERLDDRFKITDNTQETYHLTISYNGKK